MLIRRAPLAGLDPVLAYRILWLRSRVFLEEQRVTEPDVDGRELEPGAEVAWVEIDGDVVATARVLSEDDEFVIGRVATDPAYRGQGIASALMRWLIDELGAAPLGLHAQAHLEDWYAGFGFVRYGEPFMEASIEHVSMLRSAAVA